MLKYRLIFGTLMVVVFVGLVLLDGELDIPLSGGHVQGTVLCIMIALLAIPAGLEMEIVCSVDPGSGRIRVWGNGQEIIRATSVSGALDPANGWTGTQIGSFASAPAIDVPADVPLAAQVAPTNFEVIEPLSVYVKQRVRHFF